MDHRSGPGRDTCAPTSGSGSASASPDRLARAAVSFRVNGTGYRLEEDTRLTLLDALREQLGLTGPKNGCDQGGCGACTVVVDGRPVLSCLMLAVQAQGREVTTIEGLATGDGSSPDSGGLHPMQRAFLRHDALQCGFCTPGQIMSAVCLIAEGRAGSDEEIREYMSGNLCRCGAYPNIVAAIREVAGAGGGDRAGV